MGKTRINHHRIAINRSYNLFPNGWFVIVLPAWHVSYTLYIHICCVWYVLFVYTYNVIYVYYIYTLTCICHTGICYIYTHVFYTALTGRSPYDRHVEECSPQALNVEMVVAKKSHQENSCLVNIQKTMGNHHYWWVNQLFLWPFSIAVNGAINFFLLTYAIYFSGKLVLKHSLKPFFLEAIGTGISQQGGPQG